MDWQLGRRITRTGNGDASRLSHSPIVLWNRALSRGGMRRVQCLYVYSTTLHHGSINHAWKRRVRDRDVGWTTRARRAPRTGWAQPWAARGGLREPTRARQGLARVASVGRPLAEVGLKPPMTAGDGFRATVARVRIRTKEIQPLRPVARRCTRLPPRFRSRKACPVDVPQTYGDGDAYRMRTRRNCAQCRHTRAQ